MLKIHKKGNSSPTQLLIGSSWGNLETSVTRKETPIPTHSQPPKGAYVKGVDIHRVWWCSPRPSHNTIDSVWFLSTHYLSFMQRLSSKAALRVIYLDSPNMSRLHSLHKWQLCNNVNSVESFMLISTPCFNDNHDASPSFSKRFPLYVTCGSNYYWIWNWFVHERRAISTTWHISWTTLMIIKNPLYPPFDQISTRSKPLSSYG